MKTGLQNYFENVNAKIGLLAGMIGGMIKYFLEFKMLSFIGNISEAALTALICGFAGVAGKEIYSVIKKRYSKKK